MDEEFEAVVAELSRLTTFARRIRELVKRMEGDSAFAAYVASESEGVEILKSFEALDNPKILFDVRGTIGAAADQYEFAYSALTSFINAARASQGEKPLEDSDALN